MTIKSGATQRHCYHGLRGKTSLNQTELGYQIEIDAVYVCDEARGAARAGEAHVTSLRAYNRENFKPHFLIGGLYESVKKASSGTVRSIAVTSIMARATPTSSATRN